MTQEKIKRIHQWYSWILAAVMAVLGVLLILACLDIYTSGPRPYSAEAIAQRFRSIAVPVLIGTVGIIGGIALNLLLPLERSRARSVSSPEDIMLRLRQKADIPPVQKEIRLRLILRVATGIFFAALMVYPMIYFLNPDHFTVSSLNADVIRAVTIALIPAAVGLVLCWICRALVNHSFKREAAIYKQALASGHRAPSTQDTVTSKKCCCGFLRVIRITLAVVAVIFIVVGIFNGGAEDVLKKAIAICTECIGLG